MLTPHNLNMLSIFYNINIIDEGGVLKNVYGQKWIFLFKTKKWGKSSETNIKTTSRRGNRNF